jgi:hypothetical protein
VVDAVRSFTQDRRGINMDKELDKIIHEIDELLDNPFTSDEQAKLLLKQLMDYVSERVQALEDEL